LFIKGFIICSFIAHTCLFHSALEDNDRELAELERAAESNEQRAEFELEGKTRPNSFSPFRQV